MLSLSIYEDKLQATEQAQGPYAAKLTEVRMLSLQHVSYKIQVQESVR
jgi:hypothetical protein